MLTLRKAADDVTGRPVTTITAGETLRPKADGTSAGAGGAPP